MMRLRFDIQFDFRDQLRWWWQRRTRGFDDRELWSLNTTIARFVLPRLKEFSSHLISHPCDLTPEDWEKNIAKMVAALEFYADEDSPIICPPEAEGGEVLFGEYFGHLWD